MKELEELRRVRRFKYDVSGELQYVKQEEIRKVSKGERVTRVE